MHLHAALVVATVGLGLHAFAQTDADAPTDRPRDATAPALEWQAQDAFYNGLYERAAELALALRALEPNAQASYEIRSSALLFQLKRALGDDKRSGGKETVKRADALRACAPCADWLSALRQDIKDGQVLARSMLKADPSDISALFFLGKLDLNYLWLELGVLDRRTGWSEFWEAKRSLDAVLEQDPLHVRARVARAWTDYIVGSSLPRGTRWLLGGGNRTRGLRELREAAAMDAPFFERTEALFGLWDMEQRETHIDEAIVVAHTLARDFSSNQEIARFLREHESRVFPVTSPGPVEERR